MDPIGMRVSLRDTSTTEERERKSTTEREHRAETEVFLNTNIKPDKFIQSYSPSQQSHPTRDGTHNSVLRVVVVRSIATSAGTAAAVSLL